MQISIYTFLYISIYTGRRTHEREAGVENDVVPESFGQLDRLQALFIERVDFSERGNDFSESGDFRDGGDDFGMTLARVTT